MSKEYLPYQQYVIDEMEELDQKIIDLTEYTKSYGFKKLDFDNARLLYSQLIAMYNYKLVLLERISLF